MNAFQQKTATFELNFLILFIFILVLTGFCSVPLVTAQSSPREKLEDFVKNPEKVAALRRGVDVMKKRKPSDPKSWFYQAAIHAVTPKAVAEALAQDADVAKVDQERFWNRCPHSNKTHSADFLIWHRAYVYYFERILREASGDPELSLPYWNYTDESQRTFPEVFAPQFIGETASNPLFDKNRESAFVRGFYELSNYAVSPDEAFLETSFFGRSETSGFAGGVWDEDGSTMGRIEMRPHNIMHVAIGGAIATVAGNMAEVETAAFDPIFWVHHANIDRLWTTWECTSNSVREWGAVPSKEWLEESPWDFNDWTGDIITKSRLYYLDRRNLDVRYDTDRPDCRPLSATKPTASINKGMGPLAVDNEIKSFSFEREVGSTKDGGRFSPGEVTAIRIPASSGSTPLWELQSLVLKSTKTAPRRVYIEINDLKLEGIPSAGFDVFVNLPDGAKASRSSIHYVGTLPIFGLFSSQGASHHHSAENNLQFDISKQIAMSALAPSELRLKIVPFDLLVPINGEKRIERPFGFTYKTVRLVLMKGSKQVPE